MKNNTKNIIYIALFVTVIFISSLIRISAFAVPFTLQSMAVMLTACVLGWKRGLCAVAVYIAMGLSGIPAFTKGGGLFYIFELSFGYILGFIPMVIIAGCLKDRAKGNFFALCLLLLFSSLIMLMTGAAYAYIILCYTSEVPQVSQVITGFFLTFIPAEIIKSVSCALFYHRFKKQFTV